MSLNFFPFMFQPVEEEIVCLHLQRAMIYHI